VIHTSLENLYALIIGCCYCEHAALLPSVPQLFFVENSAVCLHHLIQLRTANRMSKAKLTYAESVLSELSCFWTCRSRRGLKLMQRLASNRLKRSSGSNCDCSGNLTVQSFFFVSVAFRCAAASGTRLYGTSLCCRQHPTHSQRLSLILTANTASLSAISHMISLCWHSYS
jgi:hypothetical protein